MSFDTVPPEAHPAITPDVVRELIAAQHPEFSQLQVGPRFDGWDAAMFRLGDGLAARLPRTEGAVRFLVAETTWLPVLSPDWAFPFPRFVAKGAPGAGFPWPWAIVTWLAGQTADAVPIRASDGGLIGTALAQVHAPAPPEAPLNDEQSIPMAARDLKVRERVARLAAEGGPDGIALDAGAALALWERALAAPEPSRDEFVWSHADLHGGNVLSNDGAFAGILDWGSMSACDPAVDLGFAFSLSSAAGMDAALAAYASATERGGEEFLARVRGIGLAKCVGIAMVDKPVTRAMGWRGLEALGVARTS
jgi:aminoglycoside phosphotransferase (APT) family kinase protein